MCIRVKYLIFEGNVIKRYREDCGGMNPSFLLTACNRTNTVRVRRYLSRAYKAGHQKNKEKEKANAKIVYTEGQGKIFICATAARYYPPPHRVRVSRLYNKKGK